MSQLFLPRDEIDKSVYGAGYQMFSQLHNDMRDFDSNAYDCYQLADVIINNRLIEMVDYIPRELYRRTLGSVIESWRYAGTFATYLKIFTAIFGDSAEIQFVRTAPANLAINILSVAANYYYWQTKAKDYVVTGTNNYMNFAEILANTNFGNLRSLLQSMTPCGFMITVQIIAPEGD